ncbi:hypothetical protein J8629_25110 [Serratia fonticola]|nr:hypothetical protein [Serratia fonticola]MBP1004226.1 hypothetical protein [Serratia fonticola]MBP1014218.1 hypothetical protein [Serratia fonticola]
MSEPTSGNGAAAAAVTGVTIVGVFSNLEHAVVVGVFGGRRFSSCIRMTCPTLKKYGCSPPRSWPGCSLQSFLLT